ncbi:MAG TPA: hypothetical protein VMV57_09360 [Terracidiphilus sp.]|nr:hypothetical protein [Terracidiphilus sp.]
MLWLLLGMILLFGGLFFGLFSASAPDALPMRITTLFSIAGGFYLLARVARAQLVLDGSRIQVRGAFREQEADSSEIEGFRTIRSRNGTYTRLYLKDGRSAITISRDFDTDEEYNMWLRHLVDLDQRDREHLLDEISHQDQLGATPDQRMAALANAKTWAIFLTVVAVVAAVGLNLADPTFHLSSVVFLALAPFVAMGLVWRSPLLYAVFKPKADPRADLGFVLIAAAFGLLLRNRDLHLASLQPLLGLMIFLLVVNLGGFYRTVSSGAGAWGRGFALLFMAGLYSYSLVVLMNTMPDHAPVTDYATSVVGKHISSGRSTSYILDLAPWGPMQNQNRLSVSYRQYGQTDIGDQVCLELHPGALHAPWYTHIDCAARIF